MLRWRPLPAPGDAGSSLALSFSEARALEDHARRKRIKKYLTWSCEPSKKKEELCDWGGSAGGRESRSANENSETAATETEGERKRGRERERKRRVFSSKKRLERTERESARAPCFSFLHTEKRARKGSSGWQSHHQIKLEESRSRPSVLPPPFSLLHLFFFLLFSSPYFDAASAVVGEDRRLGLGEFL